MTEQQTPAHDPVLLEYDIAGRTVELYVTSTDAAAEGAYIFQEVVLNSEYLKHGVALKAGALVVDIGAHIGAFGIQALTAVPHGDVTYIGVEPCPGTFQALRSNLLGPDGKGSAGSFFHYNEAYGALLQTASEGAAPASRASAPFPGNLMLFNKAISDHSGTQAITHYPHMPSNSTFNPIEKQQLQSTTTPAHYFEGAQQLSVPVITLHQLLHDAGVTDCNIDLLKVDVEGHEMEVLSGIGGEIWSCVLQLVVEVHDVCSTARVHAGASASTPSEPEPSPDDQQPALQSSAVAAVTPVLLDASVTATQQPAGAGDQLDDAGHAVYFQPRGCFIEVKSSLKPKDGGRVMQVARMLTGKGFWVIIDCPMGLSTNFTLYAQKVTI